VKHERQRGAILAIVLLVGALSWALVMVVLLVASLQHAIAHASLDRASALAVAHHLVAGRRIAWDAWLASPAATAPEDEEGGGDTCVWRIAIDEATPEHVRATVEVTHGRSSVRIGATAHAP
jgi:Tfp pilus assembly protein PilX